jgi:hypothetical protein
MCLCWNTVFIIWPGFSRRHGLAPRQPPLPSVSSTGDTQEHGQFYGGEMSQIIRLQESLVFYKSFNILWVPGAETSAGLQIDLLMRFSFTAKR